MGKSELSIATIWKRSTAYDYTAEADGADAAENISLQIVSDPSFEEDTESNTETI